MKNFFSALISIVCVFFVVLSFLSFIPLHSPIQISLMKQVQAADSIAPIFPKAITSDVAASRFIDSDNINYFLDPASAANSLVVAGKIGIGTTNPLSQLSVGSPGSSDAAIFGYNNGLYGVYGQGVTYGLYGVSTSNNGVHGVGIHAGVSGSGNQYGIYGIGGIGGYFTSANGGSALVTGAGNVGIGTTAPKAKLDVVGHIANSSTGTPSISNCGTNASVAGNDTRGNFITGTTPVTSGCTITFADAYATAPYCTVSAYGVDAGARIYNYTTPTTLVVGWAAPVTSKSFTYICMQ